MIRWIFYQRSDRQPPAQPLQQSRFSSSPELGERNTEVVQGINLNQYIQFSVIRGGPIFSMSGGRWMMMMDYLRDSDELPGCRGGFNDISIYDGKKCGTRQRWRSRGIG